MSVEFGHDLFQDSTTSWPSDKELDRRRPQIAGKRQKVQEGSRAPDCKFDKVQGGSSQTRLRPLVRFPLHLGDIICKQGKAHAKCLRPAWCLAQTMDRRTSEGEFEGGC